MGEWLYCGTPISMEHYSAIKGNELLINAMTWLHLRGITLSERSQSQKIIYYMTPLIWHSGKGKTLGPLCSMPSTATAHGPKKHCSM